MISLLFGVGYGELSWYGVKRNISTVKQVKLYTWSLVIINLIIACVIGSPINLEIAIVLSHYALVQYNMRGIQK